MLDASPRSDRRAGGGRARAFLRWTPFVLLVVAPLVTVAIAGFRMFTPDGPILEVVMRPTGGTAAQLFWTTTWGFTEADSFVIPLHQHPGEYERLRFPLPSRPIDFFRFDFINGPGEALIRSMRVLDRQGQVVRVIDPIVMQPASQVEGIMRVPGTGETRVVTTPDANDPILVIRGYWMTAPPRWYSLSFVTPFSLAWIVAAVLAVIVAATVAIVRDCRAGTRRDALWLTGLFFAVLAARLALLDAYPMPVPFWDQWDGEGMSLYLPYTNAGLTWHQMFTLHHEHRIFFTRVLAMALLLVNGQWDPLLQIGVNAVLASLAAVILAAIGWMAAGRRYLPVVAAIAALVFALPFALENTLAGFQSAFYFLILFSLLALWLIHAHPPGTASWWLGWLCACSALFTVAGGVLTIGAIGVFVVLRTLADRDWKRGAIDIAALAAVAAIGYATMAPPIGYHEYLKAASPLAFAKAFVHNASFPWIARLRPAVVLWIPLAAVTVAVLLRRLRATPLEQLALTLGIWVMAQSAALAYARGGGGNVPTGRYLDMLAFGFVANSLAMLALLHSRSSRRWFVSVTAAMVVWLAAGAYGIAHLSEAVLAKDGRERRLWMQEYVRNVHHYVVTGDLAALKEKRGPFEVPYFSPTMLAGWLSHPYIRQILPAAIREPIALQAPPGSDNGFTQSISSRGQLPAWDSYGPARAKTVGHFQSAPTSCDGYGHLRFDVAGNLRESGTRLTLKDTVTGDETFIRPPFGTGQGWTGVSVRCPSHPFIVSALDNSTTSWFAFRQPAGIAWPSVMAERAIQQWRVMALAAAAILAFAALPARPAFARRAPAGKRRGATT
jgi:hypothetical protein